MNITLNKKDINLIEQEEYGKKFIDINYEIFYKIKSIGELKELLSNFDDKMKEMKEQNKKAYFMNTLEQEGMTFKTIFFIIEVDFYIDHF